jgi:hypothetical protein
MMSKVSKELLMAAVIVVCAFDSAMAQGGPAPPPALNEVPLDGLSMMLLAAGAGYGAREVLRRGTHDEN